MCSKSSLSCQKTFGVISRRYLRGEQAGMFNARALGQSAQAEQDTLILYSSQESVGFNVPLFGYLSLPIEVGAAEDIRTWSSGGQPDSDTCRLWCAAHRRRVNPAFALELLEGHEGSVLRLIAGFAGVVQFGLPVGVVFGLPAWFKGGSCGAR